jgi:hypothetical protein
MPSFKSADALFLVPVLVGVAAVYYTGLFEAVGGSVIFKKHGITMISKIVVGVALTFLTTSWARRKARMAWEAQEFLKAVQISLNYVADEENDGEAKLRFRTLDECGVDELMNHNSAGIAKILSAARNTSWDHPFLRSDFASLDLMMKAVVNRISVKFSSGYLDYDFRIPVLRKVYWLGLTCERPKPGERKFAIKLRVMVVSDGFLRNTNWDEPPGFERPGHLARWECLRCMHRALMNDEALERNKEPQFWQKQLLRRVTIFRPLHFLAQQGAAASKSENSNDDVVRKGLKVKRTNSRSPTMLLKKASEFVDADLGLKQRALRARLNQGSGFDNTETSAEPRLKQASSGTE